MDNLGVLKIIADALNNSSDSSGAKKTQQKNFNLDGILQLLNRFKPKTPTETENNATSVAGENKNVPTVKNGADSVAPPLQRRMLATMTSHDDFIKRVKEKNKTP